MSEHEQIRFLPTIVASLAEMIAMRNSTIDQLRGDLKAANAIIDNCRTALFNVAGMALSQFPDLAKTHDRERDPYELIRVAFQRIGRGEPPSPSKVSE